MRRSFPTAGFALLAGLLAAGPGCYSSSTAEPPDLGGGSAVVRVQPPVRKTLRLVSLQPGRIEPFEQTPLHAKIAGFVQTVHVDIGDRVRPEQPLAELSIPELDQELRQKEALVAQTAAEIKQAEAAMRAAQAALAAAQAHLGEAEAGIARCEADYQRRKSEHHRISQLADQGAVTRKLVDETLDALRSADAARAEGHAKVESAKAALAQSRANLEKAKADQVAAEARWQAARADLARVTALLQYTQIRTPFAGIVTERNVDRGHLVQPAGNVGAKPLFVVARADIVRVFVDVPEIESPLVDVGASAHVHVQALPGRDIEGKVTRTSWALAGNRTLRTEIDLANANGLLRPGMYATTEILLKERANVLALPLAAIVRDGARAFCCCAENGRAVRKPLVLGLQVGEEVEVVSGLTGSEAVVQSSASSLQDGQLVELLQSQAP